VPGVRCWGDGILDLRFFIGREVRGSLLAAGLPRIGVHPRSSADGGRSSRKDAKKNSRGVQGAEGREGRVGWAEGCREEGAVKSLRVLCLSATSLLGGLATLREVLFGFGFRVSGVRFAGLDLQITREASPIPEPRMGGGAHAKTQRRTQEVSRVLKEGSAGSEPRSPP